MFRSSQKYDYVDIVKTLPMLDQENLFLKYTGVYPNMNQKYYSLFRGDKIPECTFMWHSGILYFKDNATFNGKLYFNIADVVAILNKCSLKEAINIIVNNNPIQHRTLLQGFTPKIKPEIRFKYTAFPENNYFGISPDILEKEHVYLVTDYWIKKNDDWEYNKIHNPKQTLCIAYYFPHNNNVKLYFPEKNEYRFYTNCDEKDVYGMYKLDYYLEKDNRFLIITKSQKDRLLLDYLYGYNAIAVQSESSIRLEDDIINKINRFQDKLILFDHDLAGQTYAAKLSDKLDIQWCNLGIAKDVYESTIKYGVENTNTYLNVYLSKSKR